MAATQTATTAPKSAIDAMKTALEGLELLDVPAVTTFAGRSVLPDSHPNKLRGGTPGAFQARRESDLVLVLGDQLDAASAAFDEFDREQDAVWMAEVAGEAEHVWSHKARIALFFSSMRHFAKRLEERGIPMRYLRIGAHAYSGFADALSAEIAFSAATRPSKVPG